MDLEKTVDETLVMDSELRSYIESVYIEINTNLPLATDAHLVWRYTLESSHTSGESPTLLPELDESTPVCGHDLAQLPIPTCGRGTPSDPGGHIAPAIADPRLVPPCLHHANQSHDLEADLRFIPPSSNPPSKEKEPPDLSPVFLFPVPLSCRLLQKS